MNINWDLSIPNILAAVGVGFLLYGRLVSLETKVEPIWRWWNSSVKRRESLDNRPQDVIIR